jgi:hypothetical protein
VTATILVGDLEDWLDLRLSPTLIWDYSSIDAMTEYLVDEKARQKSTGGADQPATGPADAREMLDNLDQLSDEEVDALLAQLSSGQAAT